MREGLASETNKVKERFCYSLSKTLLCTCLKLGRHVIDQTCYFCLPLNSLSDIDLEKSVSHYSHNNCSRICRVLMCSKKWNIWKITATTLNFLTCFGQLFFQHFRDGLDKTSVGDTNKVISAFPSVHLQNGLGMLIYANLMSGWISLDVTT